jgi:hydroxypyruvate isomerase
MPKFAANLTMLFDEVDFRDRFALAAQAGFAGVEYLFPYAYSKEALVERLRANNLNQVLHNLPAGDWAKGERGIACLPGRESEFRDGVGKAIDYARALQCPMVNCLAGIRPEALSVREARSTLLANLRHAASELGKAGIRLLIEPINTRDIPGFFLTHTRQALDLIGEVGSDNLLVQYDIYHMQIMEGDLARTMETHLARIGHIQIADNPGRNEPGTGEINYPFLFDWIDRIGYRGWIGCEYRPATTTNAGLGWLKRATAPH